MHSFLLALFLVSISVEFCTNMEPASKIAYIEDAPADPVKWFRDLLELQKNRNPDQKFLSMNIATVDSEFGALGRTVVYRGLTDNHVTFVTEKNTRKYLNMIENPKVSVTFFLGTLESKGVESIWQIRLFGEATQLSTNQISDLWTEEPVFAKIRSHISECGKPVDHGQLKEAHDKLLRAYENGEDALPQTKTFTAFKIIPTVWDFYKSELSNCIADRVQYRKDNLEGDGWKVMHVAA